MKLRDIMTRSVKTIMPDATITEAAKLMNDLDVGDLPVCANDKVAGIITDRDIVIRLIAAGKNPNECKVSEAMTSPVEYCFSEDDIESAAKLMANKQIRRLLIIDKNSKKLVGIVSLGDLAVYAKNKAVSTETLEKVSQPAKPAA